MDWLTVACISANVGAIMLNVREYKKTRNPIPVFLCGACFTLIVMFVIVEFIK